MYKKKWFFIFLLVSILLISSGCVDGQVDIKINGDGSGDLSYAMVIDKRTYDPEMLEDYIAILEENLFKVEQRDMGEIIIVNASVYLPRFRTIFDPTAVLGNEAGRIPVEFKKNWLVTSYLFDIDYDIDQAREFVEREFGVEDLRFNSMAFSVRLPNEAGENNSSEIKENEKMYTWKINNTGKTNIYLETSTINKISLMVTVGIPIFAGIAIYKEMKNRKESKKRKK